MRKIAAAVEPAPGDLILEIGPGEGALTEELARIEAPLRLIEIDPLLVERLRGRFDSLGVEVVHGDATEAELPERPFCAVGNLPYNVASPIIRRVLRSSQCRRAVFMVQKEVAKRFIAAPGDTDFGFLSLVIRLWADARILFELGPSSFFPRPKVDSAVVRFDVRDPGLACNRKLLEDVISRGFRQRRKKLSNNLEGLNGLRKGEIETIMDEIGIDPSTRAETLGLEQFDRLTSHLMA